MSADAVAALDALYDALNNQDDVGAATAARWAADLAPSGSLTAYYLYNAAWGVVIRHRDLAVGRQPVWAALAAESAFDAMPQELRRENGYARVWHAERLAHAVLWKPRIPGNRPDVTHWQNATRRIVDIGRQIIQGEMNDVDSGWRSVVLKRQVELAMEGRRQGFQFRGLPSLSHSEGQITAMINEAGPELPVLRRVQLQVQLARIAAVHGRVTDMLATVEAAIPDAQAFPGQVAHLAAITRTFGATAELRW